MPNYKQLYAIRKKNEKLLTEHFGVIPNICGIYVLTREEGGFKYAYVGQAKRLLTRLVQHMSGYQYIDLSIKKHGLFSNDNPTGWKVLYHYIPEKDLDKAEQDTILKFAQLGYQLRNKTAGGQCEGKYEIAETRPRKTYRDGLAQGERNAQRKIANWFAKSLDYTIKGKPNANKQKAYDRFTEFLQNEEREPK